LMVMSDLVLAQQEKAHMPYCHDDEFYSYILQKRGMSQCLDV